MKKLISIFAILLLVSCGVRKVDKSNIEIKKEATIETTKEVAAKIVKTDSTSTSSKTEIKNNILVDDFEIVPIDSTKTIDITAPNGKVTKYKNARISHKNSTDKSNIIIEKKILKTAKETAVIKGKETTKAKKNETIKASEKKTEAIHFSWWLLLLLLIIPVGRWIYNRYKDTNPFV
jgi:phage anti-repressor protein